MKNIITASITFDFKGKRYTPSIEVALDTYMQSIGKLPDLHGLIAAQNNIGIYSYEYEMMLAEDISFTNAQGMVAEYIVDGMLNNEAFESAWQEHETLQEIRTIVEKNMGINDLQQHPEFEKTLLEIYKSALKKHATKEITETDSFF